MKSIGDGIKRVLLGLPKSISISAWNKQKVIIDKSLFKSKFTFNIPDKDWVLPPDEINGATVQSLNGALVISSGATSGAIGRLKSRRHPSYQADQGLLFSVALIIPNPSAIGRRAWGIFYRNAVTPYQTGVLFELIDGVLYFKQITTYGGSITDKTKSVVINYSSFLTPDGTLRALFDIQGQWRGIGDYFAYMNLQKVATLENLSVNDSDNKTTIINPSLPIWFECENTDGVTNLQLIAGCVNFATEGGDDPNYRTQGVESKTPATIDNTERPILAIYVPNDYQGQHNSRDTILRWFSLSAFDQAYMKVYSTRDNTAFGLAVLGDKSGETDFTFSNEAQSCIKYYSAFVITSVFDKTKANFIIGGLADLASPVQREYEKGKSDEIVITGGDYLIITAQKEQAAAGVSAYASISLDEEI